MMTTDRKLGALSASALAVLLAGCGSGSDAPNTGMLSLSVSDGPVHEALEVCLEFGEIEIKKVGSPPKVIKGDEMTLQQVNLLAFEGENGAPLFMDVEVEAGEYEWVRLGVNATRGGTGGSGEPDFEKSVECRYAGSYVLFEDAPNAPHNAYVPSGAQTGLKIKSKFVVAQGGATNMTAEIDLQKTLTEPPGLDGDIVVRPSIRLVNDLEVGAVTGTVSDDLATQTVITDEATATPEACAPSVYAFADGVEPNAIGLPEDPNAPDADDPIATARVSNNEGTTDYQYTIGYLLPGDYDLAFTCDGENFDPGVGDVTIVEGERKTINFPVPPPTE